MGRKVLGVNGVEFQKRTHIRKKHFYSSRLLQAAAGSQQNLLDVLQGLSGLACQVVSHQVTGGRIHAQLPADKNEGGCNHRLGVRTDGRRGIVGLDCF